MLGVSLAGVLAVAVATAWPPALGAGLLLLAAGYAILLAVDDPPLDGRAALVATALVVVAGLVDWSLELRTTSPDEPGGRWRRLAWIAVGGLGALALAGALLALADLARTGGFAVEGLGALAALAVLGVVAAVARDARRER